MRFHSQIGQDEWVCHRLGFKRDGLFLDIGCGHHDEMSNTAALERDLGWSGIAIDNDPRFRDGWKEHRPASRFLCKDARAADYREILNEMPRVIDYLSIDLEPPVGAIEALIGVLESGTRFAVITYEHDFYRQQETRDRSRKLLESAGYKLHTPGHQDDFWLDPARVEHQ